MNFWTSIPGLWRWILFAWVIVFPIMLCVYAVQHLYRRKHPKKGWEPFTRPYVTRIYPDSRQSDSVRPKDDV